MTSQKIFSEKDENEMIDNKREEGCRHGRGLDWFAQKPVEGLDGNGWQPLLRKRFVECCIEFALLRMYIGYKSVST